MQVTKPTRVLIADPFPILREALSRLLLEGDGWEVCGIASDGSEAVQQASAYRPDVAILDHLMPKLTGLEAAREIRRRTPRIEILIYSGATLPCTLLELYRAPVCGCLLKSEPSEEVLVALETVRHHHQFRSERLTALCAAIDHATGATEKLTRREVETLRQISSGFSTKEIAAHLGVSTKTIDTHRTRLLRKLQLHSAVDLVRYALQMGLIE